MKIFTCPSRVSTIGPGCNGITDGVRFLKFGYFGGREISQESPLLFMVAPALRVHPSTDILLRYISPDIEWAFVGIDERWREEVRVVFRKRSKTQAVGDNLHLAVAK